MKEGALWPRISVVTPSFRQAPFLETTMRSVLGQCYPNLEYIVMDGGSDDGSVEIIERFAGQLTHWQSAPDGGQAAAINAGFARATGDILCWLNSDDFFLPGALHRVAHWLSRDGSDAELAYGACLFFSDAGPRAKVVRPRSHDPATLRQTAYIIQPSAFWTRELWERCGPLDASLAYAFDWDWFIRASAQGRFVLCPEIFSAYRHHAAHKSGSGGEKRRAEILTVVRRHAPPAVLECYEFAARHRSALRSGTKRGAKIRRAADGLASLVSGVLSPRSWRLPRDIAPEILKRALDMLG